MIMRILLSAFLLSAGLTVMAAEKDKDSANPVPEENKNAVLIEQQMYQKGLQYRDLEIKGESKQNSYQKAIICFTPLAKKGDVKAQHNLGYVHYLLGNYEDAITWYEKAAQQNFSPSIKNLEKTKNELSKDSLYRTPLEILVMILEYVNDNDLVAFRTTSHKAGQAVEKAITNRALIKTPLVCLTNPKQLHPFPNTASYFFRNREREIMQLVPQFVQNQTTKEEQEKHLKLLPLLDKFARNWGYTYNSSYGSFAFFNILHNAINPDTKSLQDLSARYMSLLAYSFTINNPNSENNVDGLEFSLMLLSYGFVDTLVPADFNNLNIFMKTAKQLIALGHGDVAIQCSSVCRNTLARWKKGFDVQKKLYQLIGEQVGNIQKYSPQIQDDIHKAVASCALEKSSAQAFAQAQELFEKGNVTQAKQALKEAADQGSGTAQFQFAQILLYEGKGDEAQRYLKQAADQSDPNAQFMLGTILNNEGNFQEALIYLKGSADQGNIIAQFLAGTLYANQHNHQKAGYYWTLSADQGFNLAQYTLGNLLWNEGNLYKAQEYFRMAANQNFNPAQIALATLEASLHLPENKGPAD